MCLKLNIRKNGLICEYQSVRRGGRGGGGAVQTAGQHRRLGQDWVQQGHVPRLDCHRQIEGMWN